MPEQPTAAPTDKVTAAALGAAVAVILIWLIETLATVDIPTFVEGAITVVVTFAAGYVKTENHSIGRHAA